jgi:hypothetical protein
MQGRLLDRGGFCKVRQRLVVVQFENTPREIPRPAGENAGLRDDAVQLGSKLHHYPTFHVRVAGGRFWPRPTA